MRVLKALLWMAGATLPLAMVIAQELPSAPSAVRTHRTNPVQTAPAPATPAPEPAKTETPAAADEPAQKTPPPADSILETVPSAEGPSTTITSVVNEVNVIFTVSDRRGRFVKDLGREDFKVLDNGRPDTQIRSFQRQTNLPLDVGLLVDASASVRDRFKFEQEAAVEFLNQTIRPRYDKAFVVGFDATPEVTQDFTDSTEALARGVHMLKPGGGTAVYDALYYACRDKLAKQPRSGPVRRAIVLLSDGDDNQSHVTREEAIEMAQRTETIVYTISTNVSGGQNNKADKVLKRISEATGGRAFFPFQTTDVADAFAEIQDELRSQYALSYHPGEFKTDGSFHTIEILARNKKLNVRSRNGYYAPSR